VMVLFERETTGILVRLGELLGITVSEKFENGIVCKLDGVELILEKELLGEIEFVTETEGVTEGEREMDEESEGLLEGVIT